MARLLILLLGVGAWACESTALNLDDPTNYTVSFDPDYLEGDAPSTLVLSFEGVDDLDDQRGDISTWQVAAVDLGELYLEGYRFVSNFQVEVELATRLPDCVDLDAPGCERARLGQHAVVLQIRNHYGTFNVHATVLVFP